MFANGSTTIDRCGAEVGGENRSIGVRIHSHRKGTYWTGYVLERLITQIGELNCDLAADVLVCRRGNANTAGFSDPLKPRSDVNAIPEDIVAFDQYVAEVDADPVQHTAIGGYSFISLRHDCLHGDRAFDGIDH